MTRLIRQVCFGLLIATVFLAASTPAQQGAKSGEWRVYGGDEASTRYSPLDQLNRDNVKDLKVAWTWKSDNVLNGTGQPQAASESTPIMVGGKLYFTAGERRVVVAADAGTGETLWMWRPEEGERFTRAPRKVSRGVTYWTDGRGDERIITVTPGFNLVALNAKTGVPIPRFGEGGTVDLFDALESDFQGSLTGRIGNSSPVVISHDTIVVGPALQAGGRAPKSNVKADIMAFDVKTGKKKWVFRTIPRKGQPGSETWLNGSAEYSGNAGLWGPFSVDTELGYVYLPIESATNDVYGGHRPGNNLFSDTLVCADIRTGKIIWYYQLVHHDIWDFDMPPHPILINITVDGKPIKAVVQLTKQAFAYVFDRVTGKPVWPMEERAVPQTTVPNEWTAATQPFPTKPPPFDVQGLTINDLIDFTPAMREQAIKSLEGFTYGPLFTPPTLRDQKGLSKGLISIPGFGGGANWQSGASDPETGYVYVGSVTTPAVIGLSANPDAGVPGKDIDSDYLMGGNLPTIQGLRLLKPPYGRITAFDMNKGELAWQIPNGDTPPNVKNNPALAGLKIPRTGSPSQAGLLVTKTLLFAGEGGGGQAVFHAYDKKTGENVWEAPIPTGPQTGLPMTYMHQGKQYIVFNTRATTGAQLVAWTIGGAPVPEGGRGGRGRGAGAGAADEGRQGGGGPR